MVHSRGMYGVTEFGMDRPEVLKVELARARRIAAQSHDPKIVRLLSDYAEELERQIRSLRSLPRD